MQKSSMFNPDVRNLGGRKLLVDQMYNHRLSLDNIKPIIGSFEGPSQMAKKQKNSISYKQFEEYQNFYLMKMKVANVKKGIDNNKPISFDLIRKGEPCGASSKQYQFMLKEHFNNLIAQKRQIDNFGSMNDRKKNQNDFIAYPPRFFRRLDNQQMNNYNSYMQQQRSLQNFYSPCSPSAFFKKSRPKTAQMRNQDNYSMQNEENNHYNNQTGNDNIYIHDTNGQYDQQQTYPQAYPQSQNQHLLAQGQHHQEQDQNHQGQAQYDEQQEGQNGQMHQYQNISEEMQQESYKLENEGEQNNYAIDKENQKQIAQLNANNSMNSAANTMLSPSAGNDQYSTSCQQTIKQNANQENNHFYQLNSSPNTLLSSTKQNNQQQQQGKTTKIQNNQNNKSGSQLSLKKSPPSSSSKLGSLKQIQQELDPQQQEEKKWQQIIEEIPLLLDINEESLKALKMHLINLILEFRLYRITDYNTMKEIFIHKNKGIQNEMVEEIFNEIVDALNE